MIMENESWYPDDYNPCETCIYWNDDVGCTSDECYIGEGGSDNECFN